MPDRELFILRHAKSSWKNPSLADFERPLKGRGKRDAARVGAYFRQKGYDLDLIICSPARRAGQTVELLLKGMAGAALPPVQGFPELYPGGIEQWCSRLRQVAPGASRVLIVGHNPGLEDLLLHLCRDPIRVPADGKLIPTATLVQLAPGTAWSELRQGSCRLLSIQRPAELPLAPPMA